MRDAMEQLARRDPDSELAVQMGDRLLSIDSVAGLVNGEQVRQVIENGMLKLQLGRDWPSRWDYQHKGMPT